MTFIADQLMVKLAKDLRIGAAGETVTHGEEWKWRSAGVQEKTLAELRHQRSRILYHFHVSAFTDRTKGAELGNSTPFNQLTN
jgi:hypothetical protein